ncbi:TerD family protein [Streptomyces sp. NPDC018693]|uniref:TerD family protein n=1 Tax=unclassified Streptomyces TaxID=2593676 RepID=UPI00378EA681
MSDSGAGLGKVEVKLRWDPSPLGRSPHHLDIVAATYPAAAPHGRPAYVVHYDSRSPDGTINMTRHSRTGQGFGYVEAMTLEFDRLSTAYARVVVGVVIHQDHGPLTFGDVSRPGVLVTEGHRQLLTDDFGALASATAATVAEFVRDESGQWLMRELIHGFDSDPALFPMEMGRIPQP